MENDFIENYIYSYLIRKHLFADSDFFFNNIGVLVNKENTARVTAAKLIASQLKEYGIKITVERVSFKEYKSRRIL